MLRWLHTSTPIRKNPYLFYDLQRLQGPPVNSQKENAKFAANRRSFDPLANQPKESMEERVKKAFGDLGSREESRKAAQLKGITVAGIHVPARPEEPTNCCMSGCVNCVWELYKDELEEYREVRGRARQALLDPKYNHVKWPIALGPEPSGRGIDKSIQLGSQETHEDDNAEDDLDSGIKAFIDMEKRLRKRKEQFKKSLVQH